MELPPPQPVEPLVAPLLPSPTIEYAHPSPGASAGLQVCAWLLLIGGALSGLRSSAELFVGASSGPAALALLLLSLSGSIASVISALMVVTSRHSDGWRKARDGIIYVTVVAEILTLAMWSAVVTSGIPDTSIFMLLFMLIFAPLFWLPWITLALMRGCSAKLFRQITAGIWMVSLLVAFLLNRRF